MLNQAANVCKLWDFPLLITALVRGDRENYFKVHLSFKQVRCRKKKCLY